MLQTYIYALLAVILTWIAVVLIIVTWICLSIAFSNPGKEEEK
jgi:hypothetical protein